METAATIVPCTAPHRALRVAVVTETYPPEINGVAFTTERLVQELLERGHSVQLIRPRLHGEALPLGNEVRDETTPSLSVVAVRGWQIPFYRDLQLGLPARWLLSRLWREHRPDVVHIATEGPLGASALAASQSLDLAVVSGFHTNFHNYSRYYRVGFLHNGIVGYLRRFHNRCQCTLVPTEELRDQLAGLGFEKLRLLTRGVDTRLFSPERRSATLREQWGVGRDGLAVLHVGRLAAEKNLGLAIASFDAIQQDHPDARFILVGDGPMAKALRSARPDLVFCGTQQGLALAEHYASADLFLFPSLSETFGNVTLEAMASGLPVVAFDYAAARQHIVQGRNGSKVPVDHTGAFSAAARRLAHHPQHLKALGWEARQTAEMLDWRLVSQELEALLMEYSSHQAQR